MQNKDIEGKLLGLAVIGLVGMSAVCCSRKKETNPRTDGTDRQVSATKKQEKRGDESADQDPLLKILSRCADAPLQGEKLINESFRLLADNGFEVDIDLSQGKAWAKSACPNALGIQGMSIRLIEPKRFYTLTMGLCRGDGRRNMSTIIKKITAAKRGHCHEEDCLLPKSCLDASAEKGRIDVDMRPAPSCAKVRQRLASQVENQYQLPLLSAHAQRDLVRRAKERKPEERVEMLAAALGQWKAPNSFYGEQITTALGCFAQSSDQTKRRCAASLTPVFEKMECTKPWKALGGMEAPKRGPFFAKRCPPQGKRLVKPQMAQSLGITTVLLIMAMKADAKKRGIDSTALHRLVVSSLANHKKK